MVNYARMYRWGITPWERYVRTSRACRDAMFDRVEADRGGARGRALDLGCGRGLYTRELARRGWEAVGIDAVATAIDEARAVDATGSAAYVQGDVTDLAGAELGGFDLFLDVGCFQGLDEGQRSAVGHEVTAAARPGATLLMLQFGPSPYRWFVEGVSQAQIEEAFPAWELKSADPAPTAGLGWPMNRTQPQWFWLRLREG
jgi:SAM-dependent methyltransferase